MPNSPLSASLTRVSARNIPATACKPLCNAIRDAIKPRVSVLALANAADPGADKAEIALANVGEIGADGWFVIPYGDSLHSGKDGRAATPGERTALQVQAEKSGVIQRLTRDDALALVNDFKSAWGRIKRALVGVPVFKGHPDAPRFTKVWPDKTPRGTIADMEAREDGLAVKPVLTEDGATLVESGWDKPSPYWLLRHVGEEGGRKIAAPFKLLSVGLVPRGNIPGLSLANAAEDDSAMKELLIKLLAALGTPVAADAADTALANAAETGVATINTLKADKTKAEGQVTTLTGEKLALANSVETERTRATAAETSLKTLRASAAKHVVTSAVAAGKLSAADSATQETALANAADFDAEAARVAALPVKLPTESRLGNLGKDGKDQQTRQNAALALVNAHMDANGCDYDTAFNAVSADPKNAALFGQMKRAGQAAK